MSAQLDALRRRCAEWEPGLAGARREYAVLCPLIDGPEGPSLLFEVRAAQLRQGGEVCFPGGRREAGESWMDCALRETEEELAIPREEIQLLGVPDFLCNVGGYLIRPALGLISPAGLAAMRPSAAEVAEVFTVPLAFFQTTPPEVYAYELVPKAPADFPYDRVGVSPDYPWSRGTVEVPVWYWEGRVIWGLTARIIRSLISE